MGAIQPHTRDPGGADEDPFLVPPQPHILQPRGGLPERRPGLAPVGAGDADVVHAQMIVGLRSFQSWASRAKGPEPLWCTTMLRPKDSDQVWSMRGLPAHGHTRLDASR